MKSEELGAVRALKRSRRFLAVTGGKGGVGKSTVAVNLAVAYANRGARVLLVDGDLGMADLNLLLGVAPAVGVREFFEGAPLESVLASAHGLHLLPGTTGSYALANLGPAPRRRLLAALAALGGRFDTIIIDAAPGISEGNVALSAAAAEVLLVSQNQPTALADAYACLKALARRHSLRRAFLMMNSARNLPEAEEAGVRLSAMAARFLNVELLSLPAVPYDPEFDTCAAEGLPFLLRHADTLAGRALHVVARRLDQLSAGPSPRQVQLPEPKAQNEESVL